MVDLKIFREYDIRGVFQRDLTEGVVKNIGYQLGKIANGPLFVSYDSRLSSPTLFNWLVSGIVAAGGEVVGGELLPTGANYFANYQPVPLKEGGEVEVAGSIQITGSHNPPEYNGFKITLNRAPFFGEELRELGRRVATQFREIPDLLRYTPTNLQQRYICFLRREFADLEGFSLHGVLDPGNGAVGPILKEVLKGLKFQYYRLINWEPDGRFPNHHPDPTEEENLRDLKKGLQQGFQWGFGFDGDGDRIVVLDQQTTYSGDQLLYFAARGIQLAGERPVVITEVKASEGVIEGLERIGDLILWKTGHSNLKEKLAETSAHLAGEVSGHLFFNDRYFGYDDGIYSFLRLVELLNRGLSFPELKRELGEWVTTPEIKIPVPEERKFQIVEQFREAVHRHRPYLPIIKVIEIDGVRLHTPDGWGLVRASNTTPVLTTRFEARTEEGLKRVVALCRRLLEEVGVATPQLEGVGE